ncbi:unnamed protein product [Rangifer tarandus platyrhynchus]|uniref:Uncharacterized protein n=2 Tax=Rangifer tarandus platyrhynchus TaxID=3082113 RepID=A0ACB0ENM3_RANTA|nr:unnamed protein product [Rangifer tarandus platyrhynchus]CAI9702024.1 unnamed protein product [Rangifer tarandus platyrhynchus]
MPARGADGRQVGEGVGGHQDHGAGLRLVGSGRGARRLNGLYGGRTPSVVSNADPDTPPRDPNIQQDMLPSVGGPLSPQEETGRWTLGRPEADTGARWPRSCAAASGTPCALARGHRGPGNGIKQRETDGTPSPGRGNEGRVESRQEKSFSGWSENYLLEEEEEEAAANGPPQPRGTPGPRGPADSRAVQRPRAPEGGGRRGRESTFLLTQLSRPPFAPRHDSASPPGPFPSGAGPRAGNLSRQNPSP